ncbi:MAG TPA: MFS transporter, partial [Thermodesulfovibrionales bacterium]|nr:MFS transporter [Thermodesulfovibrionales bacterium]
MVYSSVHQSRSRLPLHYGWVIVFTGTLCILACLGFGRFALGMLLPSMASTLKLTYSQMGFISTANFVGYLISVLVSGFWSMRMGARRFIFIALLLVGVSMVLVSRAQSFASVLGLYFLTGIGSGAANVPMMGLVSHWFASTIRGRAAGFIVIGSGFAII